MTAAAVDSRLAGLQAELDGHARIARYLGLDFGLPVRSLGDGYPENAVSWVGKITERLLKRLWRHNEVAGTPAGKTLTDLIGGCRPYIRSHAVIEALRDIQRLRNRAAHDSITIAEEDALLAVRRLLDVLAWYAGTGNRALTRPAPRLDPGLAAKAEFAAGLYVTLDYRLVKRLELSRHAVYQLFARERGVRCEHVELLVCRDAAEAAAVLAASAGELAAAAGLSRLARYLILADGQGTGDSAGLAGELPAGWQVVTYGRFMDVFVDMGRHLAEVARLYPPLTADDGGVVPVAGASGDLLAAERRSGEMVISRAGAAGVLLEEVAAGGGNLLVVGRPGSGKTTLLKHLVAAGDGTAGAGGAAEGGVAEGSAGGRAEAGVPSSGGGQVPLAAGAGDALAGAVAGGGAAVGGVAGPAGRRYRFFFDLTVKGRAEPFADFVTRVLAPCMTVEPAYVFPVFCYFARSGSVLCALDGIDEAVPETTLAGFVELFTDLAQVLSAESAVVATSRMSFLADSPQVRRLFDGTSLMAGKLVRQLHAHGVDPARIPRFSVLLLHSDPAVPTPLEARLARETGHDHGLDPGGDGLAGTGAAGTGATGTRAVGTRWAGSGAIAVDAARAGVAGAGGLDELLWRHMAQVGGPDMLPRLVAFFGAAFLRGVTTFTLVELVNEFGIGIFGGGQVTFGRLALAPLLRPAGPGPAAEAAVTFTHSAYQELLAAEYLRTPQGRDAALRAPGRPRLTEQVREFLARRSHPPAADDCILPAGVYLAGPGHHLMLRRVARPMLFDRFAVTVAQYNQFLDAVAADGSAAWDHPATPAGHTHQPRPERLPVPGYYDDPANAMRPAVAVSWWSAYAFARSQGKRLPTSLEWEAAARGADGRLFPWGDQVELAAVNCADTWAGHPLITYDAWRTAISGGRLAAALPGPVDAHPGNVSPFGVREMTGNVWEWTATVIEDKDEAVVCGGAFDNPYRAVQVSSKGLYHRRGASKTVGFRCVQDLP